MCVEKVLSMGQNNTETKQKLEKPAIKLFEIKYPLELLLSYSQDTIFGTIEQNLHHWYLRLL